MYQEIILKNEYDEEFKYIDLRRLAWVTTKILVMEIYK